MTGEVFGSPDEGYSAHLETDSTQTDLAPCPFCGSESIIVQNTHTPSYWAECGECGVQGPASDLSGNEPFRTEKSAFKAHKKALSDACDCWNKRAA